MGDSPALEGVTIDVLESGPVLIPTRVTYDVGDQRLHLHATIDEERLCRLKDFWQADRFFSKLTDQIKVNLLDAWRQRNP